MTGYRDHMVSVIAWKVWKNILSLAYITISRFLRKDRLMHDLSGPMNPKCSIVTGDREEQCM